MVYVQNKSIMGTGLCSKVGGCSSDGPSIASLTSTPGRREAIAASEVAKVPGKALRQGAVMRHPFPITPSANITPVLVVVARNMQARQESA